MELFAGAVELTLWICALGLMIPCAIFFLECVSASPRASAAFPDAPLPRTTVVIPAHDEAAGIAATLESVHAAAFPQMEVLVVADNCADATAELARNCGARVVERRNPSWRGKDFAVAFGVDALRAQPPKVVIVLDADCVVAPDALRQLAVGAHANARPVQAAYLLNPISNGAPLVMLAAFAFRVKNFVRPLGLRRWGAPCLLTGSGMAFPWRAASRLTAWGHLSEDMWWSVELTCAGYAPLFCPEARVYSAAPQRAAVIKAQRARWERGHLETMAAGIPKLLHAAFAQRRVEPLWLALELSVPPLALLTLGLTILFVLTAAANWFGIAGTAFWLVTMNLFLVGIGVYAAWWKFGRAQISLRALLAAPLYVLVKIPLYVRALFGKRIVWMRTERDAAPLNRE